MLTVDVEGVVGDLYPRSLPLRESDESAALRQSAEPYVFGLHEYTSSDQTHGWRVCFVAMEVLELGHGERVIPACGQNSKRAGLGRRRTARNALNLGRATWAQPVPRMNAEKLGFAQATGT